MSRTARVRGLPLTATLLAGCTAHQKPVTLASPSGGYAKVMVVVEENHGYDQIIGSPDAPYLNQLAATYGTATHVDAGYSTARTRARGLADDAAREVGRILHALLDAAYDRGGAAPAAAGLRGARALDDAPVQPMSTR